MGSVFQVQNICLLLLLLQCDLTMRPPQTDFWFHR
jgi:hypothetical protein